MAHVKGVSGMADRAEMHVSGEGYVGLNAIGGGITNVALVVPQERAAHAAGRVEAYFMDRLTEDQAYAFEEHYFVCPHCASILQKTGACVEAMRAARKARSDAQG